MFFDSTEIFPEVQYSFSPNFLNSNFKCNHGNVMLAFFPDIFSDMILYNPLLENDKALQIPRFLLICEISARFSATLSSAPSCLNKSTYFSNRSLSSRRLQKRQKSFKSGSPRTLSKSINSTRFSPKQASWSRFSELMLAGNDFISFPLTFKTRSSL